VKEEEETEEEQGEVAQEGEELEGQGDKEVGDETEAEGEDANDDDAKEGEAEGEVGDDREEATGVGRGPHFVPSHLLVSRLKNSFVGVLKKWPRGYSAQEYGILADPKEHSRRGL